MPQSQIPVHATQFEVRIDEFPGGKMEALMVDGLSLDTEVIHCESGNSKIVEKRKGATHAHPITIQRPFSGDHSLFKWFKDSQNGALVRRNGSVVLKSDEGKELCRFNFSSAWPIGWRGPQLLKNPAFPHVTVETIVLDIADLEMA